MRNLYYGLVLLSSFVTQPSLAMDSNTPSTELATLFAEIREQNMNPNAVESRLKSMSADELNRICQEVVEPNFLQKAQNAGIGTLKYTRMSTYCQEKMREFKKRQAEVGTLDEGRKNITGKEFNKELAQVGQLGQKASQFEESAVQSSPSKSSGTIGKLGSKTSQFEEAALKQAEEERLKAEREAATKLRVAEAQAAKQKAAEEEAAKRAAEEEAAKKAAEEEAARKKAAEEQEARLKAEEEARMKAAHEARLREQQSAMSLEAEQQKLKAEQAAMKREIEQLELKVTAEKRIKFENLKAEDIQLSKLIEVSEMYYDHLTLTVQFLREDILANYKQQTQDWKDDVINGSPEYFIKALRAKIDSAQIHLSNTIPTHSKAANEKAIREEIDEILNKNLLDKEPFHWAILKYGSKEKAFEVAQKFQQQFIHDGSFLKSPLGQFEIIESLLRQTKEKSNEAKEKQKFLRQELTRLEL